MPDPTGAPEPFTTIADVDKAVRANTALKRIQSHGIPEYIAPSLTAFEIPFFERSLELRRLTFMKHFYSRSSEVTRIYQREYERNRVAAQAEEVPRWYLDSFRKAFRDMNDECGNAFGHKVHRFLDLGCAPGGFATWLLSNNRNARGTGITLSSEAGGLRLQLDSRLRERFDVLYDDVCNFAMGRAVIADRPTQGFELVVANASIMLKDDVIPWDESIRLTYAQLLTAMQYLAANGTLVMTLRARPLHWVVDIIALLREAFASVQAVNPPFQARRSFSYLVCRGFRLQWDRRDWCVRRLRECTEYLDHITGPVDAPDGGTARIPRLCGAEGEAVSDETYQFVVVLFREAWRRQYTAIRSHYKRALQPTDAGLGAPELDSREKAEIVLDSPDEAESSP